MPWYDGLSHEEVEQAIAEGRAPGSAVQGGVIEVPAGQTEWMNRQRREAKVGEFRRRWREDSELIALAKQMERDRIVGILRKEARQRSIESSELVGVRQVVERALLDAADRIERNET